MKRPIRIGVAGLGRIGWTFHCGSISASDDFQLVAVADPDPERRREAEEVRGCRSFADFESMLDGADLEAVVVASPTPFHKAQALAAFDKGLHVFLEKPMAMDLAEAREIVSAARQADRVLTVYQPHRVRADFRQMLEVMESGRIGQVYHLRNGLFKFARRNDWQSLKKFGGGMMNNYGAHLLDQALAVTGYDVKKLFCNMRRVASMGDTEDVVKIVYETEGGMLAEIDINQACVVQPYRMEMYGTRGVARLVGSAIHVSRLAGELTPKELDATLASAGRKYPSDRVETDDEIIPVDPAKNLDIYANLARAIRSGTELIVKPQESLSVMAVMQRCRQDAGELRETPLTE